MKLSNINWPRSNFLVPLSVVVFCLSIATAVGLNSQVSADDASDFVTCLKNVQTKFTLLGYEVYGSDSPLASRMKALMAGYKPKDAQSVNAGMVKECQSVLTEAKKLSGKGIDTETIEESATASATESTDDYQFMSQQNFSAVKISSIKGTAGCSEDQTGQIVLLTNINPKIGGLQAAFFNGSDFTKRGTLFDVDAGTQEKIISSLNKGGEIAKVKKIFGVTDDNELAAKIVSGAFFTKVPINQDFSGLIYSSSWGGKALKIEKMAGPQNACESIAIAVNFKSTPSKLDEDYQICVHSKDREKDYQEKKTFNYPQEKTAAEAYKMADSNRLISLGPCQTSTTASSTTSAVAAVQISQADVTNSANNQTAAGTWEDRAFAELNKIRQENGLALLKRATDLDNFAAKSNAHVAAGSHETDRTAHEYFQEHANEVGAHAEIRSGLPGRPANQTPEYSMREYKNSPDHWGTILNSKLKEVGINHLIDANGGLWHLVVFR